MPKTGFDVRPIAIKEVFRRLTAKTICQQKSFDFSSFFHLPQHGIATPEGEELLTHHVRILLKKNRDWSILKTDVRNTFNSVSRECLLQQIAYQFADIYPYVKQLYGKDIFLIYVTSKGVHVLSSSEGVDQGDPLGPRLCFLPCTIQSVLCEVLTRHDEVTILAYFGLCVCGWVNRKP